MKFTSTESQFTAEQTLLQKANVLIALTIQKIKNGDLSLASKAVVYYGLLSFFPLISLLGSILPLFSIDHKIVLDYLQMLMPQQLSTVLEPLIAKLLTQKSGGLLSFGILGTLWSSSGVINILKRSINEIYGVDNKKVYNQRSIVNFVLLRTASILITALFIITVVALMLTLVIGQQILDWLMPYFSWGPMILREFMRWKWPFSVFILLMIMVLAYVFLPNSREKFSYVLGGAVFSTTGFIILTFVFSLYVKYFGGRWNSYGTIGSFFILIIWLNLIAYIFFIGAAINAAITQAVTGTITKTTGLEKFQRK